MNQSALIEEKFHKNKSYVVIIDGIAQNAPCKTSADTAMIGLGVRTLIATFMGPRWGPSGADRIQVAQCWPHELCYLVYKQDMHSRG